MILDKFKNLFSSANEIIKRYPIVLLSAFTCAISFISFIEHEDEKIYTLARISMTAGLGILVFFAIKMLEERVEKDTVSRYVPIFYLVGISILVFFYTFVLPEDFEHSFSVSTRIKTLVFYFCSLLGISFLPFLKTYKADTHFWEYNKNLLINFFITFVFIAVFVVGINLAILAFGALLGVEIPHQIYTHFSAFSIIFGSTFIFLSFAPKGLVSLENLGKEYPIVLKFFVQFILIPLLIIYGMILYMYSGKILFTWELPEGWVSFMVMAYSSIGIFAFFLVYPLGNTYGKSWVRFFFRIFHYTVLPLLVLLFIAIFTRLLEYGFTENRYYVLLYAIWLSLVCFYFIFWKKPTIRFVPISLFVLAIMSIWVPFLNVFSISIKSQKQELEKILISSKILENRKINFDQSINTKDAYTISDKVDFLVERNEKDFVMKFIPYEKKKEVNELFSKPFFSSYDFEHLFTNKKVTETNSPANNYLHIPAPKAFSLEETYDYIIIYDYQNEKITLNNGESLAYNQESIIYSQNGKDFVFSLKKETELYIREYEKTQNIGGIKIQVGEYDATIIANVYYEKEKDSIKNITVTPHYILLK